MTAGEVAKILEGVEYKGYRFSVRKLDNSTNIRVVATHGAGAWQIVPRHSTPNEVLQRALKCCLDFEEHEARAEFLYKGRAIYGPRYNAEVLWSVCVLGNMEASTEPEPTTEPEVAE